MTTYERFKRCAHLVHTRLNPDFPELCIVVSHDYSAALFAELALQFGIDHDGYIKLGSAIEIRLTADEMIVIYLDGLFYARTYWAFFVLRDFLPYRN